MKTKKIQFEQEIANEDLAKVMGGTSCSKISVTISLAQATLAAEAEKKFGIIRVEKAVNQSRNTALL